MAATSSRINGSGWSRTNSGGVTKVDRAGNTSREGDKARGNRAFKSRKAFGHDMRKAKVKPGNIAIKDLLVDGSNTHLSGRHEGRNGRGRNPTQRLSVYRSFSPFPFSFFFSLFFFKLSFL